MAFQSDDITEITKALIGLQSELKPVHKNAKSHHGKFADLKQVYEAIRPLMEKNGLAIVQSPNCSQGRGAAIETMLMHTSGQYIKSIIDVPMSKQNDPQAFGSALTYGRRYAILCMLGIVTDDDDGQSAKVFFEEKLTNLYKAENLEELRTMVTAFDLDSGNTWTEKTTFKLVGKYMKERFESQKQLHEGD